MGNPVMLQNVVICYPHLWERHIPPGGDPPGKYQAEFILDPANNPAHGQLCNEIHQAFLKTLNEAGKGDRAQYIDSPLRDGNVVNQERLRKGMLERPELVNKWMIAGRSDTAAPHVVDRNRQPIKPDAGAIFGGCIVNAAIDLYWWGIGTNPGVFVGLNGVQLVNNVGVEPLGSGRPSAEQLFDVIEGGPAPLQQTPQGWQGAPQPGAAPAPDKGWM